MVSSYLSYETVKISTYIETRTKIEHTNNLNTLNF